MTTPTPLRNETLVTDLTTLLGVENVLTSEADRTFYSMDFSEQRSPLPVAVVRPHTVEEVAGVVRCAGRNGVVVTTRGGGMSYTKAHVPQTSDAIVIDISHMNKVIEVNTADRYVVCEPGVTWEKLREALAGTGFRVPYLGTLSGKYATIGGGASQNATGMGRMTLAEHVVGLEVVLGDGSIIQTGSGAVQGTQPFYRYFGPDMTGMFLCDSGAFGIKTRVVMHLEPAPRTAFRCYSFDNHLDLVAAQVAFGQSGLATECFGFDKVYIEDLADRPKPPKGETGRMIRSFVKTNPNPFWAAVGLLRAWHPKGLGFLRGKPNALYVVTEAHSQGTAESMARKLTRIARKFGGKTMPTAIPMGLRHGPFLDVGNIVAQPSGELNFPVNAKLPASRAVATMQAFDEYLAANDARMMQNDVRVLCNYLMHGHFWGLEVVIHWPDKLSPYRAHYASPERRAVFDASADRPDARECAIEIRKEMVQLFRKLGALHVQVAKTYPYAEAMDDPTAAFLRRIKQATDGGAVLNPGVLGL